MSKLQETADAQRDEAKRMLCSAIGLPDGIMSGSIDRAVDCIISAAMLEAVLAYNKALKDQGNDKQ